MSLRTAILLVACILVVTACTQGTQARPQNVPVTAPTIQATTTPGGTADDLGLPADVVPVQVAVAEVDGLDQNTVAIEDAFK